MPLSYGNAGGALLIFSCNSAQTPLNNHAVYETEKRQFATERFAKGYSRTGAANGPEEAVSRVGRLIGCIAAAARCDFASEPAGLLQGCGAFLGRENAIPQRCGPRGGLQCLLRAALCAFLVCS